VINLATLEHLALVHSLLPNAQINQIQVNKGVSIQALLRFEALNPIFIVTWRKDN
jgi:precorrin-6Y C5,15-methyltransferase (decarboxylating)